MRQYRNKNKRDETQATRLRLGRETFPALPVVPARKDLNRGPLGLPASPGLAQPETRQAAIELVSTAVDLGDGVKLELVLIPAGEFLMGSPDWRTARPSENPQPGFESPAVLPGKYLVTQAQWEAVMGNNPSDFKGPKNPVEKVSWDDCQALPRQAQFEIVLGAGKFLLPTEAQWEYACRAGSTTELLLWGR